MAENRIDRELATREKTAKKKAWAPAQLLPDPNPEEGYSFRWVRTSTLNNADPMNVSSKLREGWEPVKATDHPEVQLMSDMNNQYKDNIVVGGLMLCKTPTEFVQQRDAHYQGQASSQMASVDNNLMRENDPRMPLFNERKTKVTFGNGN